MLCYSWSRSCRAWLQLVYLASSSRYLPAQLEQAVHFFCDKLEWNSFKCWASWLVNCHTSKFERKLFLSLILCCLRELESAVLCNKRHDRSSRSFEADRPGFRRHFKQLLCCRRCRSIKRSQLFASRHDITLSKCRTKCFEIISTWTITQWQLVETARRHQTRLVLDELARLSLCLCRFLSLPFEFSLALALSLSQTQWQSTSSCNT